LPVRPGRVPVHDLREEREGQPDGRRASLLREGHRPVRAVARCAQGDVAMTLANRRARATTNAKTVADEITEGMRELGNVPEITSRPCTRTRGVFNHGSHGWHR